MTKSRRVYSGSVALIRKNACDTNRGRAVVVSDSDDIHSVAFERNTGSETQRVAVTVRDRETGTKFTLKLSTDKWDELVERVSRLSAAQERAR